MKKTNKYINKLVTTDREKSSRKKSRDVPIVIFQCKYECVIILLTFLLAYTVLYNL